MLSIIMETRNNEAELAQSLSALVSGAVEGLVSDVIVLDHGSEDGSSRVADAAGCRFFLEWELGDVIRSARGEWLLVLEPGARLTGRWIDDIAEYMALNRAPARFSPARLYRKPLLKRLFRRGSALEHGLLVPRNAAAATSGKRLDDLVKALSARRLAVEIIPAWVATEARDPSRR
ncbi:glycosyltransferase involved in cell wall biosynthesis [Pararhizobium capsulatum DSM 1112]|uniref:Glycosyltransferase involved in cell wall biosynthesis n=1 Tax=Pararhizobium capsulatum DSM 1112 TaxID=1121113 RepID=A0ABU0BM95_9HYPH|nr:glycosyl transferase [Pararhizobium capsulatum]MDQ0319361.1 glycosyltransferase involved in cell wall biosynthesis [Pararhizobium capsulatum DSM 1112]